MDDGPVGVWCDGYGIRVTCSLVIQGDTLREFFLGEQNTEETHTEIYERRRGEFSLTIIPVPEWEDIFRGAANPDLFTGSRDEWCGQRQQFQQVLS